MSESDPMNQRTWWRLSERRLGLRNSADPCRARATVIVFEQNPRPYGKIEDGLPRWHVKQRRDEYEEINERLDHPNIIMFR